MSQIHLWPNLKPLLTTVVLKNGKKAKFTAEPGQLLFDEDGCVRFFSMVDQDGSVCNLQLMPIKLLKSITQFAKNWLLPYGLSIVSGEVIKEVDGTVVDDVARFIGENFAEGFIAKNFFETNSIENSAYYDITTGRLVVTEAIWVHGFTDTAGEDRSIRW
jgi:hypothetical protein